MKWNNKATHFQNQEKKKGYVRCGLGFSYFILCKKSYISARCCPFYMILKSRKIILNLVERRVITLLGRNSTLWKLITFHTIHYIANVYFPNQDFLFSPLPIVSITQDRKSSTLLPRFHETSRIKKRNSSVYTLLLYNLF